MQTIDTMARQLLPLAASHRVQEQACWIAFKHWRFLATRHKCGADLDEPDGLHAATLACLEAVPRYKAECGPLAAFLWPVVRYACMQEARGRRSRGIGSPTSVKSALPLVVGLPAGGHEDDTSAVESELVSLMTYPDDDIDSAKIVLLAKQVLSPDDYNLLCMYYGIGMPRPRTVVEIQQATGLGHRQQSRELAEIRNVLTEKVNYSLR